MVVRIRPNLPCKLVTETDFLFTEDSRLRKGLRAKIGGVTTKAYYKEKTLSGAEAGRKEFWVLPSHHDLIEVRCHRNENAL